MSEFYTYKKLSDREFVTLEQALLPVRVPLEQTPYWGAFDQSNSGRTFLGSFAYYDNDLLVAILSATLYQQKGRDWIWIKHGPLFAATPNSETVQKMCATLKQQFASVNNLRPLFIRLNIPTRAPALVLPFEHTMYDQTVVVDISQTEDAIMAGMSQSGRRSLRNAQKQAIEVDEVTDNIQDIFTNQCFPILQETGTRDGFGIHPLKLYLNLLETLPEAAKLYVAKVDGKIEAWAITTEYNTQGMYYYGGSSHTARTTDAAYKLHWEIMLAMKQRGNLTYDFMGIAGKNYEGLKNVTQFKVKFSKNIVDIPFTYDLPLKPLRYRLLAFAIRLKRRIS